MTNPLRKHLEARAKKTKAQVSGHTAKLSHTQKITPSQRKSELLRKKLNRGVAPQEAPIPYDCYDCPLQPCGKQMTECDQTAITMRCDKCGSKAKVRAAPGKFMERYKCPVCRSG